MAKYLDFFRQELKYVDSLLRRYIANVFNDLPQHLSVAGLAALNQPAFQERPGIIEKDDGFLWGVPKSRRTRERRMKRKFGDTHGTGVRKLLPVLRLLTCDHCGHVHEPSRLCPHCYGKAMEVTRAMQAAANEKLGLNPIEHEILPVFQGESVEERDGFCNSQSGSKSVGYGVKSHSDVAIMEKPQPLYPAPKSIDAVFFSGSTKNWGIILAIERRPDKLSSALVYLKVPDLGLLVAPSHPDTVSFRSDENAFAAAGIEIVPQLPMSKWLLNFSGQLRNFNNSSAQCHDVAIQLEWHSTLPHFDFDTDMDPLTTAKAFAREPWSREFFNKLKEHHQTHYEQMGFLKGQVSIDGRSQQVEMPAFRDHSYGKLREWRLMHRYVFHHIFMDDGAKGVVGVVCQPSTCSRLVLGHWWTPEGEGAAVTEVDLDIQCHGEGGTPPLDYAFTFTDGRIARQVRVSVQHSPVHYLGWDWEARMVETWVNYDIGTVHGHGITEWQYRHNNGRPDEITKKDPDWTAENRRKYLIT